MIKLFSKNMLIVAMLSNPTMAIDVPETSKQTTPAHIQDKGLSATEGELICNSATVRSNSGVALCAYLKSGRSGTTASFTVSDDTELRRIPFLQIIN